MPCIDAAADQDPPYTGSAAAFAAQATGASPRHPRIDTLPVSALPSIGGTGQRPELPAANRA